MTDIFLIVGEERDCSQPLCTCDTLEDALRLIDDSAAFNVKGQQKYVQAPSHFTAFTVYRIGLTVHRVAYYDWTMKQKYCFDCEGIMVPSSVTYDKSTEHEYVKTLAMCESCEANEALVTGYVYRFEEGIVTAKERVRAVQKALACLGEMEEFNE